MTIRRMMIGAFAGFTLLAGGYALRGIQSNDLLPSVQAQEPGRKLS